MSESEEVVVDRLAGTKLGELRDLVLGLEDDYLKGMSGVKTRAREARKALQNLEGLRKDIRQELLAAMKKDKQD